MKTASTVLAFPPPQVPDHEVLRPIGKGAYGEIWLARASATGRLRAIKAVFRSCFDNEGPYETEFAGVRKFEEISREHEGFIDVLHIRRDDEAGYFAYVMEAADDLSGGPPLDAQSYTPRTLKAEKERRGRLPPAECLRVALAVAASLAELHRRGFVHRDIKPGNIVFVRGAPKLADIGLVTEMHPEQTPVDARTLVGTPGYMDPLVHGSIQGDLYGFGRLLAEVATGLPVGQAPPDPATLAQGPDLVILRELLAMAERACHSDRARRYRSADQIYKELVVLQAGTTWKQLRRMEFWTTCVKRFGPVAAALLLFSGLGGYLWKQRQDQALQLRQRIVGSHLAHGTHAVNEGDLLGGLSWYAEAWRLDQASARNEPTHRLRLGAALGRSPSLVQMWFTPHPVNFARFTAQENQVFLAKGDHRWAVHDLASGLPLHPPVGLGAEWEMTALAPAHRLALTACRTNCVGLWDFTTGQLRRRLTLDGPDVRFFDGALSSDGRWAAATGQDAAHCFLALWSLAETNAPGRRLPVPGLLLSVAFSPDSRRLLTAGENGHLALWDVESGECRRTFPGLTDWVNHAAFSPDGRRIASGGFDWTARIWDTDQGTPVLPPLRHQDGVRSVEFSPDGTTLVTAGLDWAVRLWSTTDGRLLLTLRHNSKPVYAGFSPTGRYVVTSTYDGTVRVWDLHLRWQPESHWPRAACSSDGERFAVLEDDRVELRRASDGQVLSTWPLPNATRLSGRLNHHGTRLVLTWSESGAAGFQTRLFETAQGQPWGPPVPTEGAEPVRALSSSGELALLQSGGHCKVWDFERGRSWLTLPHTPGAAAFDPKAQRLACAAGNRVEIWAISATNSRAVAQWNEAGSVSSLAWSPDGRWLLVACSDGSFDPLTARVREALTGTPIGAPLSHLDGVLAAVFAPDGQTVLTCSEDFTAVLWHAQTGRQRVPALRHADHVVAGAFSADGRMVATASRDRQVRVWDVASGEPLTPPLPQREAVRGLSFAAQGRKLVVRQRRDQTVVWALPLESRAVGEVEQIASLLSAQRTASGETVVPHTAEALRALWTRLRQAYPADFSLRAAP